MIFLDEATPNTSCFTVDDDDDISIAVYLMYWILLS